LRIVKTSRDNAVSLIRDVNFLTLFHDSDFAGQAREIRPVYSNAFVVRYHVRMRRLLSKIERYIVGTSVMCDCSNAPYATFGSC
jgi:hypothetical protein